MHGAHIGIASSSHCTHASQVGALGGHTGCTTHIGRCECASRRCRQSVEARQPKHCFMGRQGSRAKSEPGAQGGGQSRAGAWRRSASTGAAGTARPAATAAATASAAATRASPARPPRATPAAPWRPWAPPASPSPLPKAPCRQVSLLPDLPPHGLIAVQEPCGSVTSKRAVSGYCFHSCPL